MTTITEQHRVFAGVIWLDYAPIRSVVAVRYAADPEATWITLRPGPDYWIADAEGGGLYVVALVGTLVEIDYTIACTGRLSSEPARQEDPQATRYCEYRVAVHHSQRELEAAWTERRRAGVCSESRRYASNL